MNNTSTGSVRATKKLIPELRFPEFENEGEWILLPFDKVYSFLVTNSLSRENLNYESGSVKNIHYGDIHTKFSTLFDITKEFVPFINSDNSIERIREECYCKEGDLIFADASEDLNDVGKSIEIINLNNEKLVSGLHTLLARQKESLLAIGFAGYLFKTDWIRRQIQREAQGAKVLGISASRISNVKISYPKNPIEQQKIASCLSSLDEIIAAHSQKLEALKTHKKGLMQNLFPQEGETIPKYRFPEFEESLKKIGFAELGEIKIGLTHKPDYIETGIPFLSSRNISGGFIDFKNIQHISKEKFDSMPKSTKPKVGDILFTRVGSNLGNPIILEVDIKFGIFVSLGFFRVNKKAYNYYIKYWMESDLFWKQVNQKVAGGAKDNLNSNWLKEFELYIPSIEEQGKIASCFSSLDTLIKAQAEKIEQLKLHKKGLMQGLFPSR